MLYLGQTRTSRLSIPGARVLYSYCMDNPPCCDVYEHTPVTCEDGCAEWFLPYKFYVTFTAIASDAGLGPSAISHNFGTVSIPVRNTPWISLTIPEQATLSYGGIGDYWTSYTHDLSGASWYNDPYGGYGQGPKGAHYLGRVNSTDPSLPTTWWYVAVYVTPGCGLVGVPTVVWANMSITAVYWSVTKNRPDHPTDPGLVSHTCQLVGVATPSEANVGRDDDDNCIDLLPCQVGDFYAS